MHKIDLEIGKDLYETNRKIAEEIRRIFDEKKVKVIEFMGSVGSGKTLIIERLIELMREFKIGVIVGDVSGDDDYRRIKKYGVQVVNINTGKECHLDAHLIEHAIEELDLDVIDYMFIENVGNLVCPADFELGAHRRGVVISITEGDDMVRKHPLIFQLADFIVINKIDLAPYMDARIDVLLEDIKKIAPKKVFLTDAKNNRGIKEIVEWIKS
ncbi:MAG: hydrogenase nickel incorporation protein HypB [Thermoplasmatales archaeon]|nr:hydrogenase nickel incorporation protein HypB [Thermoplasmatales archaeon]